MSEIFSLVGLKNALAGFHQTSSKMTLHFYENKHEKSHVLIHALIGRCSESFQQHIGFYFRLETKLVMTLFCIFPYFQFHFKGFLFWKITLETSSNVLQNVAKLTFLESIQCYQAMWKFACTVLRHSKIINKST